ncbi:MULTISPECIES: hypothetical protein [Cyanophyceae]|uniref:hypothetical protein n=1 Tax=Cyanophyceae TaxID=3028117 RepID=UPI001688CF7C|nr:MULTISPECIES: hypothetical protein [Cyanophyceae]MBD1918861.1 hypothetical protein [Phormidium sp. FACHB-77]MBD2033296.1 hypothetical protein [Phormidium sp. FACHB-322]MBD2053771.1 hypothetical protein [Leptolyngbya sp. FACHB-60]
MPFADIEQTRADVLEILGLPADAPRWVELVQRKLERVPVIAGEAQVAKIEGWIENYQKAEAAIFAGADQAGLIKADVLEWALGSRYAGHEANMRRYAKRLLNALFIPCERREIERENGGSLGGNSVRINR